MNTKLISQIARDTIEEYKNFHVGTALCSIPYFNNKVTARRAGLRVDVGKGSSKDIFDEIMQRCIEQKIDIKTLNSETLKKFLVDNNLGIDCSGFAYYVLHEEGVSRGKGGLDRNIAFSLTVGILGKIKAKMRPIENAGVETFADIKNSKVISLKEIEPGDIITMLGGSEGGERNHILIIHQVEYQNFVPTTVHYVHAIAWPTDGEYGHGIHEGKIEIMDSNKTLLEQKWIENEKTGEENYTFSRAKKSTTELRRLKWF